MEELSWEQTIAVMGALAEIQKMEDIVPEEERAELDAQNLEIEEKAKWAVRKLKIPPEEWCENPLLTLAEWLEEMDMTPEWLADLDNSSKNLSRGATSLTDLLVNGLRATYSEEKGGLEPVLYDDYPYGATLDPEEFLNATDPQEVMELAGQAIFSGDLKYTLDELLPLCMQTDITRD